MGGRLDASAQCRFIASYPLRMLSLQWLFRFMAASFDYGVSYAMAHWQQQK
jgi:hypothetical protein